MLDLVEIRTSELVAQRLRSDSVVISRLCAVIEEAIQLGYAHRSIYASIEAGGLDTSWNNYRVYLARARKARRKTAAGFASAAKEPHEPFDPTVDVNLPTPNRVLDALINARRTASKDYARIARNLHQKDHK